MHRSLWADYQAETWGAKTIEQDEGFICFQTFPEHLYVQEIYVRPECRKEGVASKLAAKVEQIAVALGKSALTAKVDTAQRTAALSMQAQLGYGFVPFHAEGGIVWFRKELKES